MFDAQYCYPGDISSPPPTGGAPAPPWAVPNPSALLIPEADYAGSACEQTGVCEDSGVDNEMIDRRSGREPIRYLLIAVTVLVLAGATTVAAIWLRTGDTPTADRIEDTLGAPAEGWVVYAFLHEDLAVAQREQLVATITRHPAVVEWRYLDKAAALEEAVVLLDSRESVLELIRSDPDILPDSLRVLTLQRTDADAIASFARRRPGIEEVIVGFGTLGPLRLPTE